MSATNTEIIAMFELKQEAIEPKNADKAWELHIAWKRVRGMGRLANAAKLVGLRLDKQFHRLTFKDWEWLESVGLGQGQV